MDCDCFHLVYHEEEEEEEEEEAAAGASEDGVRVECFHCSKRVAQEEALQDTGLTNSPSCPFQRAQAGAMAPHVQDLEVSDDQLPPKNAFTDSETRPRFVRDGSIFSLRGAIHMPDVSPNGTWLCETRGCRVALRRLRLAGLACVRLPELNRMVLEQKNDDGLLSLASEFLSNNRAAVNQAIELFGPFSCDATLAPVLHAILRSPWIEERKETLGTNNGLKLGWAQEFYDWKILPKNGAGSRVFSHARCPSTNTIQHGYKALGGILDKMRWCGNTPWSAVHAVRCSERRLSEIACGHCAFRALNSCVFLMECAAAEASRERDWLVRNEAVIQLCWLIHRIDGGTSNRPDLSLRLVQAWAEAVCLHSLSFHEYAAERSCAGPEALVVMFGVDHRPTLQARPTDRGPDAESERSGSPARYAAALLHAVSTNAARSPETEPACARRPESFEEVVVPAHLGVPERVPERAEAGPQRLDKTELALVSCYPRVAASALRDLTFDVPRGCGFSRHTWPVFVNPTRACYQLFRALALPCAPSPTYLLELLARTWRRLDAGAIARFMPTCTGGRVRVSPDHYGNNLLGPVEALLRCGAISLEERDLTALVLAKGVLPCFAARGDSLPDRLVSSTLAIAYAASGVRMYEKEGNGGEVDEPSGLYRTVSTAGLIYFSAWYVLVYAAAVHTHPTLKAELSKSGSVADKHLCSSLRLARGGRSSDEYEVREYDGREMASALRCVLGGLLPASTVRRCGDLYVPELLMQLPYAKGLNLTPSNLKGAIESRDAWFADRRESESDFFYLGAIAQGLHSSVWGAANLKNRPIAQALRTPDVHFDPWCDTLITGYGDEEEDHQCIEAFLRLSIKDESEELFYSHSQGEDSGI